VSSHGSEKTSGDVLVSGSAAVFAASGRSRYERMAHGGQKRACFVPDGVCEEQGSGEPAAWSQTSGVAGEAMLRETG